MGSQSDWPVLRHAADTLGRARRAARGAHHLGPPHARPARRLCEIRAVARPARADRGRRRGRASPRHGGGLDRAAGARRADGDPGAQGHGQPALDRPDARRHPGRHARHRPRRRGERGAARRRDPRAVGRRARRPARRLARAAIRRRWPKPRPTPHDRAGAAAAAQCDDRHRRRRPARPHVRHGRGPARLPRPCPHPRACEPRRAGLGRLHDRRLRGHPHAARLRGGGGRRHLRVRECERARARPARLAGARAPLHRRAAHQPGPHRREELPQRARHPDRALAAGRVPRRARRRRRPARPARDPQDHPARL